ncbi:MAG: DUF1998 domain-containing protein, partial [Myxococcales bacterium]|nr:DUF1998 domain-containing protein [Myxococcales bacterium]
PTGFESFISRVLLLERLREVNALLGFTRIESTSDGGGQRTRRAPIGRTSPTWVPATQVHGEGIFVEFSEKALVDWENVPAALSQEAELRRGHRGWRARRGLDPNSDFPGIRFALLHTIAHLLIRELALDCGYNAASIRERVYADTSDGKSQAGILIYTAAADSDGTLGGLVDLGKPANLGRLLRQALDRSRVCASDPLCAEHNPRTDSSLHAASCHACSFVSETSCECGNRYLDRALVVPTLQVTGAAFFTGT